jgi:hypothetical protein
VPICLWFERFTRNVLTMTTIYLHSRATRKRGHCRARMDVHGSGLQVIVTSQQSGRWVTSKPRTTKTVQATTLLGEFAVMVIVKMRSGNLTRHHPMAVPGHATVGFCDGCRPGTGTARCPKGPAGAPRAKARARPWAFA